jgi:predicted nucleotide-binding protein
VERLHFSDYVTESQETERTFGSNIFIVHGHDIAARESVKSLLHQLDLRPIVLQEEGSGGRTIIENFEAHAENSGFAVVLMTPDDTGYPGEQDDKAQGRARQNVVLEFGYFLALLGRQRVRVLYKEGVEIPSDLTGILYIPMDEGGAWQLKLAKEIKAAGFEIDLNAL